MDERIDTLIIGGGQSGLAMSHMLSQQGLSHLVVERGRIAERWRSERWDGLRFQFPNWSVRLPDFPFPHTDPDGFATSADIVAFLEAYAARVAAQVREGVTVKALGQDAGGTFRAETSSGTIVARNVVVATGPYQRPVVPDMAARIPVHQVHAAAYGNPGQLPPGAVLVVGSGASGAQIAEELQHAGRQVFLAVGQHRRMPRRYRGRDFIRWLEDMGLDQTPVAQRGPDRRLPLITGADGGHTIDFRNFAAQGITLVGHLTGADGDTLHFAADVADSVANGDAAYLGFLDLVDAHIARNRLDAPMEPAARVPPPWRPGSVDSPRQLDLRQAGIGSVLWCTGYRFDYDWIDLPVLTERGEPSHRDGITDVPGLYFLGLPWLSRRNSSFLSGVGDDAARLAAHIAARA